MRQVKQIEIFLFILSCFISPATGSDVTGVPEEPIDLTVVQDKIQALGLRDDTLEYSEQPSYWLKERRQIILPELIAGLDNPEKRIAQECLKVLTGVTESHDFYTALVRIAADNNHPINKEAVLCLCKFPLKDTAEEILRQALTDTQRFEDPRDRAVIALALGLKSQAVELIVEYTKTHSDEYYTQEMVKWLGDIGHDSAIVFLEEIAEAPVWYLSVEAYLAMAKIDPAAHGLTETQKAFLIDSRMRSKWTSDDARAWWAGLTQYDKTEIRPFVIHMLNSDYAEAALVILQMWKDKEALTEIGRIIRKDEFVRSRHFRVFLVAYLDIEGSGQSTEEVASILKNLQNKNPLTDEVKFTLREIAQSEMNRERKIEVLTATRTAIGPMAFAQAMEYLEGNKDSIDLILTFMHGEEDIPSLGAYTRAVTRQNNEIAVSEIVRSLDKLVSRDTLVKEEYYAAQSILEACAVYKIESAGQQVNIILSSNWPLSVKLSAAVVCTELEGDREKGLAVLYDTMKSENPSVRAQAAGYLMKIPCRDHKERLEREDVALSCTGLPCEDYAYRLLTTCAGQRSIGIFEKLLDEENVSRAVYAAWVLAQNGDVQIRQKGLRRIAIYALFNQQTYQQGSGIDFNIAPGLDFHQATGWLNPQVSPSAISLATIPAELLTPFTWNGKEQAFSIRAYRSMLWKRHYSDPTGFLRGYAFPNSSVEKLDGTLLPLLRAIVNEDPMLRIKYKQGNPIAYFPNRQTAAQIVSKITGEKTTYPGLAGEPIDSEEIPEQSYEKQNQRIAEYVLDQIQAANIIVEPQVQNEWDQREVLRYWINDLVEQVGPELKEAFFTEAQQKGMAENLGKARFSIWTNQD